MMEQQTGVALPHDSFRPPPGVRIPLDKSTQAASFNLRICTLLFYAQLNSLAIPL